MVRLLVTAMVASGLMASSALLQPVFAEQSAQARESRSGPVSADSDGMTLYTLDKLSSESSACTAQCADNGPPLMANDADQPDGDSSVVTRPDGNKPWAFKGPSLYKRIKDAPPGDATGDRVQDVRHVARP